MSERIPNKDEDPKKDAESMAQQAGAAFGIVLPRKPLPSMKMSTAINRGMGLQGKRGRPRSPQSHSHGIANALTKGATHHEAFLSGGWEK